MHDYEKDFDTIVLPRMKAGLSPLGLDFADTVVRPLYVWAGEHGDDSEAGIVAIHGLAQCMTLLLTRGMPEWTGTAAEIKRVMAFLRTFNEAVADAFEVQIVHMSVNIESDDDEDRLDRR